jgi:hypothetical protein|tara:strand:- start:16 stop:339 length:324 start_codon:yes stop_codon:yes gene_type:complete
MAITKEIQYDKTEIVGDYKAIQCREATIIKEDGVELSRSFHRHVLHPSDCSADLDSDGNPDGTFTHTDTDISGEPAETQAVCNAVWTDAVKAAWKTHCETIAAGPGA